MTAAGVATPLPPQNLSFPLFPPENNGAILDQEITKMLNGLVNPRLYDRRLRPNNRGPPLPIAVTIIMNAIIRLDEIRMDMEIDFTLRQEWTDTRLRYADRFGDIRLDNGYERLIWVPNTMFPYDKTAAAHRETVENTATRLQPDGTVSTRMRETPSMFKIEDRNCRLSMQSYCQMELTYFPMDTQQCIVDMRSFSHTVKELTYCWMDIKSNTEDTSVNMDNVNLKLPQYQLKSITTKKFTKKEADMEDDHSYLEIVFTFKRVKDFYIIVYYLPAAFIVMVSWAGFYVIRQNAHFRVGQAATLVLTMSSFMSVINNKMPQVAYIKFIDIYINFCFLMVIGALVVSTSVGMIMRRKDKEGNPKKPTAARLDKTARVVFPLIFLAFNIAYWTAHFLMAEDFEHQKLAAMKMISEDAGECDDEDSRRV